MTQTIVQQLLAAGQQHHQAGRLAEAEAAYRRALAAQPDHPLALHLLGLLAMDVGQRDAAIQLLARAAAVAPAVPEFHFHLAVALEAFGRRAEAAAAYEAGLRLNPDVAEVQNNLGNLLVFLNRPQEAERACRAAIALRPDLAAPHNNLGNALKALGRVDEAIAAYRDAVRIDQQFGDAYMNLGQALAQQGRIADAADAFADAARLQGDPVESLNSLGNALTHLGRHEEAEAVLRQAMARNPAAPGPPNNLGNVLSELGRWDEAIAAFELAIRLKPQYPEAHSNLGNALLATGALERAVSAYQEAIRLRPDFGEASTNLAGALKDQSRVAESVAAYRRAVELRPQSAEIHSNLLYGLHFLPPLDAPRLLEEHRAWSRAHADPLRPFIRAHDNGRDPDRRLRIGYVSGDLRNHPVGRFILPAFEHRDPAQVEIVCFSQSAADDDITKRLRAPSAAWHTILGRADEEVADLIRREKIDILVDLAGHTANNRLLVFAPKPAPVQISCLGYPGTTGMDAIDYRITDALADPAGAADELHAETLLRLPGCAWCYEAPAEAPDVVPPPAERAGIVTFGSFNNLGKVNDPLLDLWSRLLSAVPTARLVLKAASLRDEPTRRRLLDRFAARGVTADRVHALPPTPNLRDHFAAYGDVDIALDTFPYHGTTTTCDALWMGVPVVTLAGELHVSRVGVSLLTAAGLPELIAATPDDYVRIAAELAADVPRLASLRRALRPQLLASPLTNGPGFARRLEAAYRAAWQTYACAPPRSA